MIRFSDNLIPCQRQDEMRGWWCIFGVTLVLIFNVSLIPTFDLLFEPFFEGDHDSASVVIGLFLFLSNLTILATGFLMKDFSARFFVIFGTMMTFLGLLLTSFVTSLTQLIFSFSVIIGVGIGLLNPASFVAVLSCFTHKRTYAISIAFSALGFGRMFMPELVKQALIDYGHRPTICIVGALAFIGVVGAQFLVPIRWKPCVRYDPESQPMIIRKSLGKSSILNEIIQATDLDLLWNLRYIKIMFGLIIVYASSTNLNIIFPVYLQKRVDYDAYQIGNCIFAISVSDNLSRLAYPLISKALKLSSSHTFLIGVLGLGVIRCVLLHMELGNYRLLLIVCAILGFFRALTVVNQVLILVDFCEEFCPTKLPGALGLSVVVKASLLVLFGWMFNGMQMLTLNLSLNFHSQIFLFFILILTWLLDP